MARNAFSILETTACIKEVEPRTPSATGVVWGLTASFSECYSKAKNTESSEFQISVWTVEDVWSPFPINISTAFEYSVVINLSVLMIYLYWI